MRKYKVIQWGCGYTGTYSLKYVLMNSQLELVGLKCFTPEKEGKNVSELCGITGSAITATRDSRRVLDCDADCVLYMPRDPLLDPTVPESPSNVWFQELLSILASGKNVVTSLTAGTHHKHLHDGPAFVASLNAACRKGNSTVFFTGFDPGFSDILAFTMSGAVGAIRQVQTWEVVDYSAYPVTETLTAMGYGTRPEDLPSGAMNVVRTTWGGVPYLLGDALGVDVEELKIDADMYLSPKTFTAVGGLLVREGTIGALRFTVTGMVSHKPLFIVNHVTRIGQEMAPDWPRIGADGGYRVEIDSFPPFKGEFPMGRPGGTGSTFADAMAMTAGRCVNCIEAVVHWPPGYRSFRELSPLGGRYAVLA
jgi:2,4-diaminopentanoate dehydrogenase